ncbi:MAG: LamG domain-containing protein [Candidatus Paceibacterota bacterium]|jgi:hypothetical protein
MKNTYTQKNINQNFGGEASKILVACLVLFFISVPLVTFSASIKNVGKSGLVGYWNFNDGVGTKTGDISGNGNTGTVSNATWTQGRFGKALYFGGVNSSVSVPNKPIFDITSSITLSAWYKKDVGSGTNKWLVHKATVNTSYSMFIEGGLKMRIEHPAMQDCATTEPSEGVWHHAVSTYDGTNMRVYVDGVLKQTCAATGSINISGGGIEIGSFSSTGYPFKGVIDEVRIYNRALSASEISDLYKAGGAVLIKSAVSGKSGLVGYWPMNEGTGTQMGDSSGNKNNGSLVNSFTWATGKLGNALNFNGTNNYVSVPSIDSSGTNVVSVSWWMYKSSFHNSISIVAETSPNFNVSTTGWVIGPDDNTGYFAVGLRGNVGYSIPYYNRPSAGVWHHYVAILDKSKATNEVSFYIDGVLQTPATYAVHNNNNTNNFGNDAFYMGMRGGVQYPFAGKLDDFRIYNRALAVSEILDLYKSGGQSILNASRNNVLTRGLVGLWSFDGKDMNWRTNKALDRSGNGNDGTLVGMSTTSSPVIGKIGQGMKFNGNGQYITTAPISLPKFTVAAWVNPSGNQTGYSAVVSDQYPSYVNYVIAFTSGTTNVYGGIYNAGWYQTGASTLPINKWTHVSITFDNNILTLYINGASTTSVYAPITPQSSGTGINIGKRWDLPDYFSGLIDDVRIYNRALSATELKQLYNMGR